MPKGITSKKPTKYYTVLNMFFLKGKILKLLLHKTVSYYEKRNFKRGNQLLFIKPEDFLSFSFHLGQLPV